MILPSRPSFLGDKAAGGQEDIAVCQHHYEAENGECKGHQPDGGCACAACKSSVEEHSRSLHGKAQKGHFYCVRSDFLFGDFSQIHKYSPFKEFDLHMFFHLHFKYLYLLYIEFMRYRSECGKRQAKFIDFYVDYFTEI